MISVIALLLAIALPALAGSRETARRVKCLTNLKGIGTGLVLYMDTESDGVLPDVSPLHGGGGAGGGNDPSLLDVLESYVDAPLPRKDEGDEYFTVVDPYKCPSDRTGTDETTGFEPAHRVNGTSYEYQGGLYMLAAEFFGVLPAQRAFAVTRAFEADRSWPVLSDAAAWHNQRRDGPGINAVYFGDWRADWTIELTADDLAGFFDDVRRSGGLGG